MQKVLRIMLLFVGAAFAMSADTPPQHGPFEGPPGGGRTAPNVVPEIGVGSAASAFALLSGMVLVIRGRRKK
jgi:hypothetical protein